MLGVVSPEDRVCQGGRRRSPQGVGSPREQEGRRQPPVARLASVPSVESSRGERQGAPVTCAAGRTRLTRPIKHEPLGVLCVAPPGPRPLGRGWGDGQAA